MSELWPKRFSMPPEKLAEAATFGLLVVLGGAVIVSTLRAVSEWSDVRRLTQTYTQLTGIQPEAMASVAARQREEMVKRITSNRLIAPPPMQLTGVLGDQAIFNGAMMLKVGQSAGDMKILAIGPNWVEVENKGQQQKLWVFQPMMSGPPQRMAPQLPGAPAAPAAGGRRTGGTPPIVVQP